MATIHPFTSNLNLQIHGQFRRNKFTTKPSLKAVITCSSFNHTNLLLFEAAKHTVWRRPSIGHADPTGGNYPLVTREGHNVLDIIFTSPILNLAEVANLLDQIDGVAGHGIITKTPCTAVIAAESGLCIIENTVNSNTIVL